jgi:hypothetical protein
LPLLWGGGFVVFLLVIENASLKMISIWPDWMSVNRCEITLLMASLFRSFFDDGARTSSSRWTNSHQNGADSFVELVEMIVSIILACIV